MIESTNFVEKIAGSSPTMKGNTDSSITMKKQRRVAMPHFDRHKATCSCTGFHNLSAIATDRATHPCRSPALERVASDLDRSHVERTFQHLRPHLLARSLAERGLIPPPRPRNPESKSSAYGGVHRCRPGISKDHFRARLCDYVALGLFCHSTISVATVPKPAERGIYPAAGV